MDTQAHHIIHEVVLVCDRMEHLVDMLLLVINVYLAEPKVHLLLRAEIGRLCCKTGD